jgi:mRNA-degrading endonuclease RelE of RelBE toxin-antitoxin system
LNKKYNSHLIDKKATINDALIKLNELGIDSILFVIDEKRILIGSITDGDIRRGLIKGLNINENILQIIEPNPKFIIKDDIEIDRIKKLRGQNYRIIPVVSKTKEIVGIINFRESKTYLPIDVVIMAGGRGQRLAPLTNNTPKPMLKISNKPILEHNIDRFINFGITDFWISVNYLSNK